MAVLYVCKFSSFVVCLINQRLLVPPNPAGKKVTTHHHQSLTSYTGGDLYVFVCEVQRNLSNQTTSLEP